MDTNEGSESDRALFHGRVESSAMDCLRALRVLLATRVRMDKSPAPELAG
jgi:hypothetical protein